MNMIRLWAVALCVSLGLLAMPVAVAGSAGMPTLNAEEQAKVKEELFAAFDRSNKPLERRKRFSDLSPQIQGKVLAYYAVGKKEQPDEWILLRGVYNLMNLYKNVEIAKRAIAEYAQTGRVPSETPLGLMVFEERINEGFPSAKKLIDWETIAKIDDQTKKVYGILEAEAKERIAKGKEELAKGKEELAKGKELSKTLDALLKAL